MNYVHIDGGAAGQVCRRYAAGSGQYRRRCQRHRAVGIGQFGAGGLWLPTTTVSRGSYVAEVTRDATGRGAPHVWRARPAAERPVAVLHEPDRGHPPRYSDVLLRRWRLQLERAAAAHHLGTVTLGCTHSQIRLVGRDVAAARATGRRGRCGCATDGSSSIFDRRCPPFGMGLIVSEDDGATWSAEAVIRADASDWDLGYPVATELGRRADLHRLLLHGGRWQQLRGHTATSPGATSGWGSDWASPADGPRPHG